VAEVKEVEEVGEAREVTRKKVARVPDVKQEKNRKLQTTR
jgi:hypothetical protein